jgi:hypothetical protein
VDADPVNKQKGQRDQKFFLELGLF